MTSPLYLTDLRTQVIYFGIDGSIWHLSGAQMGKEGAKLGVEPDKMYFPDFENLWTESARGDGARYEGTILGKREIDFEVQIADKTVRGFHQRNSAWWRAWSTRVPGVLAFHTRHTGWRWIRVRLAGNVEPKWGRDPALIRACDYDMTVAADDPLYRSFKDKGFWRNEGNVGNGVLQLRNWTETAAYPTYTMPGPGKYSIQDGVGGQMIALPELAFGQTLRLDTHPLKLSLRIYDQTTGLDGRSAWKGMTKRFRSRLEPWSMSTIKVSVTGGTSDSQIYGISTPRYMTPF